MNWGVQIKENNGNTVRLSIMPAANAIIGQYEMFIETKSTDSSGEKFVHRFQHKEHLYILFNAWCTGNDSSKNIWQVLRLLPSFYSGYGHFSLALIAQISVFI